MKAYKGFNEELKCRGFQYEVGKEYEEPEAELCKCGFHACENPLDVFHYYPPASSRYCEVEMDEVDPRIENDSKRCSKKVRIGVEIGFKGIIEAGIKFIMDSVDWVNKEKFNTRDRSAAIDTRYHSAATNTGHRSAAIDTGYQSAATNTGDRSAAINTGYQSVATNAGYWSVATNTGYQSAAINTGKVSVATVEGEESIAIATGIKSRAKGSLGCYIVLAEWCRDECGCWHIKHVQSAKVDGEKIKADTFYTLKNGEFVEVK